jgi:hypothetical protein
MVLPHELGLLTSKGNAAKPDASCTQQELDDEQGDGDQAKGLRNKMDSVSMLHEGGNMHASYSMPSCEVRSTVRCLVGEHCGGAKGDA